MGYDVSWTHLKQLEAEAIHILREVAAEFRKPVMLYSIGRGGPGFQTIQRRI